MDNDSDKWTIMAIEKFGGSFMQALGVAACHADHINLAKIKAVWSKEWDTFEKFGETMRGRS